MADTKQLKGFIRSKYSWPGCYPMFALCTDGGCLCHDCAKDNAKQLIYSTRNNERNGWAIAAVTVNWEDHELICDHCGNVIESAYDDE